MAPIPARHAPSANGSLPNVALYIAFPWPFPLVEPTVRKLPTPCVHSCAQPTPFPTSFRRTAPRNPPRSGEILTWEKKRALFRKKCGKVEMAGLSALLRLCGAAPLDDAQEAYLAGSVPRERARRGRRRGRAEREGGWIGGTEYEREERRGPLLWARRPVSCSTLRVRFLGHGEREREREGRCRLSRSHADPCGALSPRCHRVALQDSGRL